MKKVFLLCILIISCFKLGYSQKIKPPAGFTLVKKNNTTQHLDHYVKDGITFMADAYTGPLVQKAKTYDKEVAGFLSENYRTNLNSDLHFSSGVYYGLTFFSSKYFFIVLDYDTIYKISSTKNDTNFKNYCDWLLSEVKSKGKINAKQK